MTSGGFAQTPRLVPPSRKYEPEHLFSCGFRHGDGPAEVRDGSPSTGRTQGSGGDMSSALGCCPAGFVNRPLQQSLLMAQAPILTQP